MTLTLDLPRELEEKLAAEAARNGVSRDEFVRTALEEKLNRKPERPESFGKIIGTDAPVRDFSRERGWLEKNRDQFDGQHVALDGDKLIAADSDPKKFVKKVRESGINGLYIVYVEGSNRPRFISGGLWRE